MQKATHASPEKSNHDAACRMASNLACKLFSSWSSSSSSSSSSSTGGGAATFAEGAGMLTVCISAAGIDAMCSPASRGGVPGTCTRNQ